MQGALGGGMAVGARTTDAAPLQCPQISRRASRGARLVVRMACTAAPATLPIKQAAGGGEAGSGTLSLRVADPEKAKGLVHRHVVKILQNQRQGSANTKTRSEVRGGGKKPFAQKGTGNARMGSRRSPLLPGGGVVFGPKPKDWSIKMNKKERRLATATALQSAADAKDVTVVDDVKSQISEAKTRTLVKLLAGLGLDMERQHVLLIVDELTDALHKSGRNIPNLRVNRGSALNTYDILRADKIVIDQASLAFVNEFFGAQATA